MSHKFSRHHVLLGVLAVPVVILVLATQGCHAVTAAGAGLLEHAAALPKPRFLVPPSCGTAASEPARPRAFWSARHWI